MLTPEQLATIRSQLAAITPGKWLVQKGGGIRPAPDYAKTGNLLPDELFIMRAEDDVAICSDCLDPLTEQPSKANAQFIAEAPATIKLLLDEVDRLTTERTLLVGVWRAADEYNDCNDGLTCSCVDNLAKALDKYDEYRKALTVVNGG